MHAIERAPPTAAPIATSTATFSFGAHSAYTPSITAKLSAISVLGVPGYADNTATPASHAPRAIAWFVNINSFIRIFSLFYFLPPMYGLK
jgi:hypothetical protein